MSLYLWMGIELLFNLIQGLLISYFVFGCLDTKKKKNKPLYFIALTVLFFAVVTAFNFITSFEGFAVFIHLLVVFLFCILFMKGTVGKKLFVSSAALNIATAPSIFITNLISFISKRPIEEYMANSIPLRLTVLIGGNLIIFALFALIKRFMKKENLPLAEKEWVLLSVDLIISIIAYTFMYFAILTYKEASSSIHFALCVVTIIGLNISTYYLLTRFGSRYKVEMENSMLKQNAALQSKAINETKYQYEELQKSRHDFNNVLNVIKGLNSENKKQSIDEYIDSYQKKHIISVRLVDSGNDYIDAIINTKIAEAGQAQINVNAVINASFPEFAVMDICGMLGNMFDNAIRGSRDSNEKSIVLSIKSSNDNIEFTMKNSINGSVLNENPELKSDKIDNKNHGYGVNLIREVSKKYNGFADFFEEQGFFCCNVVLYFNQI